MQLRTCLCNKIINHAFFSNYITVSYQSETYLPTEKRSHPLQTISTKTNPAQTEFSPNTTKNEIPLPTAQSSSKFHKVNRVFVYPIESKGIFSRPAITLQHHRIFPKFQSPNWLCGAIIAALSYYHDSNDVIAEPRYQNKFPLMTRIWSRLSWINLKINSSIRRLRKSARLWRFHDLRLVIILLCTLRQCKDKNTQGTCPARDIDKTMRCSSAELHWFREGAARKCREKAEDARGNLKTNARIALIKVAMTRDELEKGKAERKRRNRRRHCPLSPLNAFPSSRRSIASPLILIHLYISKSRTDIMQECPLFFPSCANNSFMGSFSTRDCFLRDSAS